MKIAGVMIAGGQSRRMGGQEKSFLALKGKPLAAHVVQRLAPQVDQVVINANGDADRFRQFQLTVVADQLSDIGTPLAGLQASLSWAKTCGFGAIVTVPSDGPFLPDDLVARLGAAAGSGGAAIAGSAGQPHFLTGYWRCSLLEKLTRAITEQHVRRVQDWAAMAGAEEVVWPLSPHDPFFNINTPTDLQTAETLMGEHP